MLVAEPGRHVGLARLVFFALKYPVLRLLSTAFGNDRTIAAVRLPV